VKRKLFTGFAASSLVLCVSAIAAQTAGGWADDSGRFHHLGGPLEYIADGRRGMLQLVILYKGAAVVRVAPSFSTLALLCLILPVAWFVTRSSFYRRL
jgi:hypothetical protein